MFKLKFLIIFFLASFSLQFAKAQTPAKADLVANCSTPDGVFVLQNGQNCRSGQLYLSSTLNLNSSTNGVQNFDITDPLSIVINNGSSIANASISIPSNDMRGLSRVGLTAAEPGRCCC